MLFVSIVPTSEIVLLYTVCVGVIIVGAGRLTAEARAICRAKLASNNAEKDDKTDTV